MTTHNGYRSYSYLEAGRDYVDYLLAPQRDRVPVFDLGLTPTQTHRVSRLLKDLVTISLHDHPIVVPHDIAEYRPYVRQGRSHTGYEGLSRSGLTAVFDNLLDGTACITSNVGWKFDDIIHDLGYRLSDLAHQDYAIVARSVDDILTAHEAGKLALVFGLEAATPIENEVDRIDILYGFGIRQMGIAYSEANSLGSGFTERTDGGLTHFGERAVRRMNQLGMAIDISHSGDRTSLEVIRASSAPVFITHAGARAVWGSPRMKPDDVIIECAKRGGLIGIEAAPHTTLATGLPGHNLHTVMRHFQYCVDLVGIEHVAFGPDTLFGDHVGIHNAFAASLGVNSVNDGLDHERVDHVAGAESPAEAFPNIISWLVQHGYSDDEIAKVAGGNILRVLENTWYHSPQGALA